MFYDKCSPNYDTIGLGQDPGNIHPENIFLGHFNPRLKILNLRPLEVPPVQPINLSEKVLTRSISFNLQYVFRHAQKINKTTKKLTS